MGKLDATAGQGPTLIWLAVHRTVILLHTSISSSAMAGSDNSEGSTRMMGLHEFPYRCRPPAAATSPAASSRKVASKGTIAEEHTISLGSLLTSPDWLYVSMPILMDSVGPLPRSLPLAVCRRHTEAARALASLDAAVQVAFESKF
jgi:hypothetical protein